MNYWKAHICTIWYALPAAVRDQYQGLVVAVYNGAFVDQDLDRRTLYLRIKARFGREPVRLVDGGDQPFPEFQTYSALGA